MQNWWTITMTATSKQPTQPNYITMREPITAIMLGITLGMLLSVAASKALSARYIATCSVKPTYTLVKITNLFGDTYYCVNRNQGFQ